MNKSQILEHLGLKPQESQVYLALLEHGSQTIAGIAQKTKIHRPIIYKLLPELQEKGLVSEVEKGKRTYFQAESPEKLETLLHHIEMDVEQLIPDLKHAYDTQEHKPRVTVYEGKRGIANMWEDLLTTLNKGETFYRYSSQGDPRRGVAYLPKNYRERRNKKQLQRFIITNEARAESYKSDMNRALKTVPTEFNLFTNDVSQMVYGNKVAYIDYNTDTVAIIENEKIAEFQRQLFKLLYALL